jgi:hypothetical protein
VGDFPPDGCLIKRDAKNFPAARKCLSCGALSPVLHPKPMAKLKAVLSLPLRLMAGRPLFHAV